jgi:hypothetical protein
LCRFICGCFESTKRKETAVTATSTDELKWMNCVWQC